MRSNVLDPVPEVLDRIPKVSDPVVIQRGYDAMVEFVEEYRRKHNVPTLKQMTPEHFSTDQASDSEAKEKKSKISPVSFLLGIEGNFFANEGNLDEETPCFENTKESDVNLFNEESEDAKTSK